MPDSSLAGEKEVKSMRPFLIIWVGQTFSLLGSGLVQFALIWYLTETFSSALILAIATIVWLLPQILLGPIAGALVDRWNRRVVMIAADGIIALAIIVLALCFLLEWVPLWLIYAIMFVRSLGTAFHRPAMLASTPLLIPEKHLTRIAGLNQGIQGATKIIVPPIAALLLAWLPMQSILAIDLLTATIAIIPLFFIHIPNPVRKDLVQDLPQDLGQGSTARNQRHKPSVMDDLWAGLTFVWGWTGLRLVFGLALILNIFLTPAFALLPIMITETFGGDAIDFAWVSAGWGTGAILGGLLLGVWSGFNNRMILFLGGLLLLGACLLVIGFTPPTLLWMLIITTGFGGLMNAVAVGTLIAVFQVVIPNEIQGRVFTLFGSINQGMIPLGLLIAAPVADSVGVQIWFTLGGIVMMTMFTAAFFIPAVLHLESKGKQMVSSQ
ncbi:MAG: MFS transporter [Chloroflexota bacterium]